jgi:DNA-directed RNA polymerase omega subunit
MVVSREAPESQFAYVVVAARRARQLMMGGRPLVDNPQARKTTRIAEEELQRGLLEYETKDPVDGSEDKDKDTKRRK